LSRIVSGAATSRKTESRVPAIATLVTTPAGSAAAGQRSIHRGLGNPGPQYAGNRHNVGFQCVDELAARHDMSWRRSARFKSSLAEGHIGPHRVLLVKPLTFMNDSGTAVGPLARYYKVPPERILVIYDDLDLPLARLRACGGRAAAAATTASTRSSPT
jgi:aminoacyl-tRNA hydrolase